MLRGGGVARARDARRPPTGASPSRRRPSRRDARELAPRVRAKECVGGATTHALAVVKHTHERGSTRTIFFAAVSASPL